MHQRPPEPKSLVIAGNNCFAETDAQGRLLLSAFDAAMLRPFVSAWPGSQCEVLTIETPTSRERTSQVPGSTINQLIGPRGSTGVRRLLSMPIILIRMLKSIGRSTTVYARLPSPTGACLLFAGLVMRRPVVCSLHGAPKWSRNETSWQSILRLGNLYRMVASAAVGRSDLIFATDMGLANTYGLRKEQIHHFSNTLVDEVPPFETRPPIVDRPIRFGFVGRLSPEKNPLFALHVMRKLSDMGFATDLTIVGDGQLRNAVDEMASANKAKVDILGWVDDPVQVRKLMTSFDFLLLPSLSEGSPKVMTEAMGMSTVVVTWRINSTVGSIADDGNSAVLLEDLNPEDWATRIVEHCDPAPYRRLAKRAHEQVADKTVGALTGMIRGRYSLLSDKQGSWLRPMMWNLVWSTSQVLRVLPRSVRSLVASILMGMFRFGTTKLHYAIRSIAVSTTASVAGRRLIIGPGVYILSPERLTVGSGVSINHFCYVDASGFVTIESKVRIGNHSTIVSGNHDLESGTIERLPIRIGEGAWVGSGSRILSGVTVGSGATIGAGAVVTKNIPDGATALGVPARLK